MQSQEPTYCVTCKRKTMPSRGHFVAWAFILLLILGVIPGIIYLIYYYMKDLRCPICKGNDWGDPDDNLPDTSTK